MAPRKKHPLAAENNRNYVETLAAGNPDAGPDGSLMAYAIGTGRDYDAGTALLALTSREDGWLRIVSHDNGHVIFVKYKFTTARFPNHYVMWRQVGNDPVTMLWGILRKVEAVDEGLVKPVYDVPYNVL